MEKIYFLIKRGVAITAGLTILIMCNSCEEFESDQEVPSYIQIDSIGLTTEYDVQGTSSHSITDAWIIVNDRLIGAFELPAVVPVLAEGLCDVRVMAGIKQNGIASTRIPYPYYQPLEKQNIRLTRDSITKISGNVTYYSNTFFAWKEDFESNLTIVESNKSDTVIERTSIEDEVFEGEYSGRITLTDIKSFYLGYMENEVDLPKLNTPVFLEMNYKIENLLIVGLYSQITGSILQEPVLNVNTTDTWKKIYINLTPIVNRNANAYNFKVYFESSLGVNSDQAIVLLDNIKLVHRETTDDE
jgi:hypothetical protein